MAQVQDLRKGHSGTLEDDFNGMCYSGIYRKYICTSGLSSLFQFDGKLSQ